MKFKSILLLLFVFGIVTIGYSQNEEKKSSVQEEPSQEMQNAQLAINLVKYGYENKSALSLIEASRILINMPLGELKSEKSEEDNEGDNGVSKKSKELISDFSPAKLLTDAKEFAKGDENIIATIKNVEVELKDKTRGRVYGPAEDYRKVSAYSRRTDYIYFRGRELAEVAVIGDGDNDLDLYIYDSNNNLIAKDDDYTDKCYVSFYPRLTETYKVVVKNRGDVYSNYVIMTN
jgi:hydroxymethylpyrimidine pyrophosphatase-like HAD family hydrolase